MENKFSIGGQFWNDEKIFDKKLNNLDLNEIIFDGASSSIRYILSNLNIRSHECVLLPSYLCPSIIENFNKLDIKVDFYAINEDLEIDLDDLKNKLNKLTVKAIYIINYFGMYNKDKIVKFIMVLKKQGYIIIEDAAHCLYIKNNHSFIGNFVFNSLRKFAAIDGSILLTDKNFFSVEKTNSINKLYLKLIKNARIEKKMYIDGKIFKEDGFLKNFQLAESEYEKNMEITSLTKEKIEEINKLDLQYMYNKRKENFEYLYDKIKDIKNIKILTKKEKIKDAIPFGMVILIDNRDYVRKELFYNRIFTPILWNLTNEKFIKNYPISKKISENILMIPIDQRYEPKDFEEALKIIEKCH